MGEIGHFKNLIDQTHAPSSVHRYTLYWDGAVGYVPQNISWEYLPTNRVSLNGNVQAISNLWGMAPSESLLQALWHQPQLNISEPAMYKLRDLPSAYAVDPNSVPAYQPICVFGENVYQLRLEGKPLYRGVSSLLETLCFKASATTSYIYILLRGLNILLQKTFCMAIIK